MDFANAVPWGFIIDNLGTIAQIILVGWAAGKIAAVTAAIVGLSGAFDVLKTAVVGAGAAIAAHPILAAVAATAAGVASIVDSANRLDEIEEKIQEYDKSGKQRLELAENYTAAVNGNLEALDALPKKYRDMAEESMKARIETEKFQKAFEGVTDAALLATKAIFEAGLSSEEQVKQLSALWGDELADNFRRHGASAMDAFLSQFQDMPADVRSVMVQVANSVLEGVEKVKDAVEDVPKVTETVAGSLRSAAAEIQEYFVTASQGIGELVNDGFLSAEQGADSLKEQLGAKAEDIGKNLSEKFKNPALKDAVVNAMREIGKQSGNALFVEVADAMQKVEKTVKEFSDKAKTLLEETFEEFDTLGVGVGNVLAETENFVAMVMESAGKSLIQIVNKTTGEIVATGNEAAQMMGSSIGDILRENQTLARTTGGMVAGEFNTAALQLQEAARKTQAATELAGDAIGKNLSEPMDRFAGKSVKLVDDGMGNLKMVVVDAAEAGGSAITEKMIPPLEKTG
jgi:conjugal transfer/entry exclusion protein